MLNKDEEYRVASFIGVLRSDIEKGLKADPVIELRSYLWLAEKLKEVNDENKELVEENRDLDQGLNRLRSELKDLKSKHDQADVMLAKCYQERQKLREQVKAVDSEIERNNAVPIKVHCKRKNCSVCESE